MSRFINNLVTTIGEEQVNPFLVQWDMEIENDHHLSHPDSFNHVSEEIRSVSKIKKVEVILFDKYGIDVTDHFTGMGHSKNLRARLESALLEQVESESVNELRNAV
jgi:hypothetical protein